MDLEKDFDQLIDAIKSERDKLTKILKSLDEDNFEDYSYQLEAFRMDILPMIQDFTDKVLSWVKNSNTDDLKDLEKALSCPDMTNGKFLNLVEKHKDNYFGNRFLYTYGFLHDYDLTGLCEPVNCAYTLLCGLYTRINYLASPSEISDDSLARFCNLFYGMV